MEFTTLPTEDAAQKMSDSLGTKTPSLICGKPSEIEILKDRAKDCDKSIEEIIEASRGIDPQKWIKEQQSEINEEYENDFGEGSYDMKELEGDWSGDIEGGGVSLVRDIDTEELLESVAVASLTVNASWEIPAHFKYGNWNDCPSPEVHCAFWKHWHEKYGADIICVSHDVIEAYIQRPPETQEAAMELAWEQYWYCQDIVDQGVESVANLGGLVLGGEFWSFWWD